MPRIRTIKPEFPQSESMGRVSRDARLTFILLWTLADDSGRLRGNSRMLASLLYPYDDDAPKLIGGWLAELSAEGCIVMYASESDTYIQIAKWLMHQKIDKPSKSRFPAFDESSRILANPRESSPLDQGPRTRDQGPGIEDQGPGTVVATTSRREAAAPRKARGESASAATWESYSAAYNKRYGADPVRNATVNAQMAQFVARIGAEEAPHVAAWYVRHNSQWYVRNMHAVGQLSKDAEKLRTEWATRRQITATAAQQADRTQANFDAFAPLIEAARREAQRNKLEPEGSTHAK